ncbi:ZPR1 zinc-finger domain-containing protein [Mrakia frigida]|uniref:zinc finger-containing protein ZPR1 n=1 Tax=Mrakia frigida TaxID=29902 RepID=UPI003FCC0FDA
MAPKALDPFFPSIGSLAANADARAEHVEGGDDSEMFEDEEREVQEVESLCMRCHEQGMTRLLLTSIPFFREVVVMSFRCEHCGENNTEIQSAGMIQERGSIYTAHIRSRSDFDRQIVKSPTCTITIPEFQLTIPPNRGQLTNVEGIVRDTMRDLALDQPLRKIMEPDNYEKIGVLVERLREVLGDETVEEGEMTWEGGGRVEEEQEKTEEGEGGERPDRDDVKRRKTGEEKFEPFPEDHKPTPSSSTTTTTEVEKPFVPFTITLDDPAGNSFLQFIDSISDPKWTLRTYLRTREQDESLGMMAASGPGARTGEDVVAGERTTADAEGEEEYVDKGEGQFENEEVYSFPGHCSSCGGSLDTLMKKVNIPYFQDIIIMSTNCQSCGYKDNEVKSGGAVSAEGKKITLKVEDAEDLSRDLLKSETCGLEIPEIELLLQPGTLGGRFTTLEGILTQVYEELSDKVFASGGGDSTTGGGAGGSEPMRMGGFEKFLMELKEVMTASRPFTLILDDPLANSYLQNPYAPDADPNMTIEFYKRDFEQNEDLGLNDMIVEGYEGEKEAQDAFAASVLAAGAKKLPSA